MSDRSRRASKGPFRRAVAVASAVAIGAGFGVMAAGAPAQLPDVDSALPKVTSTV